MPLNREKEIYSKLPTPCFIIDEKELKANVRELREAVQKYWSNAVVAYSFKTNALPWILEYFRDSGFYAEVCSADEYELALLFGYRPERIVYNGLLKTRETFLQALTDGCIVNIDAERELGWLADLDGGNGRSYPVGIRANIDLEAKCPGETVMGEQGSRFGFCFENGELKKALDYIRKMDHIRLAGLHLHYSTRTRSLGVYRALARAACEIAGAYQLELDYVDLGGGFFGGLAGKPGFADYLQVIAAELAPTFPKNRTALIIEPGTSLVSSPFSYLTEVTDIKRTTAGTFIVTDGCRSHIDPLMKKESYCYDLLFNREDADREGIIDKQVIGGFTCMEFDRFFVLANHPPLSAGDRIIYRKVGGYTLCLAPMFMQGYPPVYAQRDGTCTIVRDRVTMREFADINS